MEASVWDVLLLIYDPSYVTDSPNYLPHLCKFLSSVKVLKLQNIIRVEQLFLLKMDLENQLQFFDKTLNFTSLHTNVIKKGMNPTYLPTVMGK